MGSDASSIHQQPTSPLVTNSKTFSTGPAHLPASSHTDQQIVSFKPDTSDTNKNLPESRSDSLKLVRQKSCVTEMEKDNNEKLVGSICSKGNVFGKTVKSSFEDSSSIIVIERKGKHCKLIAPSLSSSLTQGKNTECRRCEYKANREATSEPSKGKDILEYSPVNQRKKTYGNSGKNFLGNTKDELITSESSDFFFFCNPGSNPKNPNYLDIRDAIRGSSTTTLSDTSILGIPLNRSFSGLGLENTSSLNPDVGCVSESVAISWPPGVPCAKRLNCLACCTYTELETTLPQIKNIQHAQKVNFKSKFASTSPTLVATPVNKEFSHLKAKKVRPSSVKPNLQVPSSIPIIRAD